MPRKFLIEHKDNIARLMAEGLSARQVGEAIGVKRASVLTFAKKHNLGEWASTSKAAPWTPPADFDALWAVTGEKRLALIVGASEYTVRTEAKRRGLVRTARLPNNPHAKPPKPKQAFVERSYQIAPVKSGYSRDMSRVGQAADFLKGKAQIWRCNATRQYDPKGEYWNRGGYLLTDADVISRAKRLGWRFVTI